MALETKFGPDDTEVVRIGGPVSAKLAALGEKVAVSTSGSETDDSIDLDDLKATRARVASNLNMETSR